MTDKTASTRPRVQGTPSPAPPTSAVRTMFSTRGVVAAVAGTVGALAVRLASGGVPYVAIAAYDVGVATYLALVWTASARLDAKGTASTAKRHTPNRVSRDLLLLTAAVVSLAAVVYAIADASNAHGLTKALQTGTGVITIVVSWLLVHTLFTSMYARQFYARENGGVDFNSSQPPVWTDFAYLAFTIGMTFQVSDTDLQTVLTRRLALRHALLSYLFGAVIIAVTINLIAGLTK